MGSALRDMEVPFITARSNEVPEDTLLVASYPPDAAFRPWPSHPRGGAAVTGASENLISGHADIGGAMQARSVEGGIRIHPAALARVPRPRQLLWLPGLVGGLTECSTPIRGTAAMGGADDGEASPSGSATVPRRPAATGPANTVPRPASSTRHRLASAPNPVRSATSWNAS